MPKDTPTRMIEATARLLQHRGYHGTALSDILKESGAPRGSLYFHFPGGKDELVIAATRAAAEETTAALADALADAASPALGVRAFTETAAELMRDSGYTFGCPVSPLILDAPAGLRELEQLCRQTLETWMSLLRAAFTAAGMPSPRADTLALLAVSAIEGALLIARAGRDVAPLLAIAAELDAIVSAALPRKRARARPRVSP